MNIEAVLIDDEQIALDVLEIRLLEIGGVSVIGKYREVSKALSEVPALKPGIIFLDIEMPGENGLSAAESFKARCPEAEIVFVTAHAQYAIDAFDRQALGYLLKPVDKGRLAKTLERYAAIRSLRAAGRDAADAEQAAAREARGRLRLQLLGSLELYAHDGRLLTWRTKKTKELFAYLWHQRGQPAYRYRILEDLWPDYLQEPGQRLFHTSLYNLRSMLKAEGYPDIVRHGDERYWLDSADIESDVERLEDLLGGKAPEPGGLSASGLYRGDYLETEHYGWADQRRYELRSEYVAYLRRALASVPEGDKVALLRKLAELEPYRSEYHERLIDDLERRGDRSGAEIARRQRDRALGEE
ncbi:response regulator [Cohnella sp. JJ-181]|uniref:response regulator n=1 Tax=Cohnella rhizoplanae TaxID=2974897 RepID=UPI0022FF868B|nr:response regulator [Cohnella sp. JJ-181]CAI6086646.1 Protein-glutamate methylesterase/protein-glutamine glutaminase [Cohnella sp. JJ-181]